MIMSETRQADVHHHPRYAGDAFPLAPQSVIDAYLYYWQVTHEKNQTAREERMTSVNGILNDFCDGYIQPPVYTAAMLMSLMDKLEDPLTSRNAYRALRVFLEESEAGKEDDEYTLGLLSDRQKISTFWQENINEIIESYPEIAQAFRDDMSESQIPREMWEHDAPIVQRDKIIKLKENVNIVSILIQSAELLEWLSSEKAGNNGETYAYMYAARSIFAPICKMVRFGGLEMALQSRCSQLELEITGQQQFVEKAATHLEWIESPEQVEQVIQSIFEHTLGDTIHERALSHNSQHGIIMGEGISEGDSRVTWRVKSLGRIAHKLARSGIDAKPMDIVGTTVIVEDESTLAAALSSILKRINSDERIELVPSPSRDYAVHVRGDLAYIDTVREALGYSTRKEMERHVDVVDEEKDGFRVAKVTFTYYEPGLKTPVPVEMQINTVADREQARGGKAAHLYKRYPDARETYDTQVLQEFRGDRDIIRHNTLVGPSKERAAVLRQMIMGTSF